MAIIGRLRTFVGDFTQLVQNSQGDEQLLLHSGKPLLEELLRTDDWLPAAFAKPDPDRYRQYLLHCDPLARFSVMSFVWGPNQATPVHDHTVWGMVGVLRGREVGTPYERSATGVPLRSGADEYFDAGQIDVVSPMKGDIHRVRNALSDSTSVSIHVYGANIGAVRRTRYSAAGEALEFISGYSNAVTPNLWDRSQ